MAKVPAKANGSLPQGKLYTGSSSRIEVAGHVNAYLGGLTPAQRNMAYGLPAAQVAASAGCKQYAQQYAWRQHLRSGGSRAGGAHWGAQGKGKHQANANAQATKLAAAGNAGAKAAKQQVAAATPQATPAA